MMEETQDEHAGKPPITCYNCGHTYSYLGCKSHPGVCPRCGQRAVSPSGTLQVQECTKPYVDGLTAPIDDTVNVSLTDTTDRSIQLSIAATGDVQDVVLISIDDMRFSSTDDHWEALLDDYLVDAVDQAVDRSDLELATVTSTGQ